MEIKNNINFNNFFFYYLVLICFSSIFFMSKTYQLNVNNSMAEWLINYQGGFGRRGFLGELFTQLSLIFDYPIRKIILYFLYVIFISYYLLIYLFFRNIKTNYIIIISLLSPLFILSPLAELEALGRKDILIPLFFLFYCNLYNRLNLFGLSLILLLFYTILLLTHEVSIFYLPFFYLLLTFKIEKLTIHKIIALIFIALIFLFIIYILSNSVHSPEAIKIMCERMKNILNDKCGMGAYVLNRSLKHNIAELGGLNYIHLIRNFSIFILGYSALIILIQSSKFNESKNNILNKFFNLKLLIFLTFLPTLIPFTIAVDWGRWFNLSYTMLILFYFFCIKNEKIFLNEDSKIINYLTKRFLKNKTNFFIIVFILCFTWNPKAVYHEDIGSIPIYRMLNKIITH